MDKVRKSPITRTNNFRVNSDPTGLLFAFEHDSKMDWLIKFKSKLREAGATRWSVDYGKKELQVEVKGNLNLAKVEELMRTFANSAKVSQYVKTFHPDARPGQFRYSVALAKFSVQIPD